MNKVIINGLDKPSINTLLLFMNSKLNDQDYITAIETGGNDCDMEWMNDDVDISDDDMLHELFELYGTYEDDTFTLEVNDYTFTTQKQDENWSEIYQQYQKN